MNADFLFHLGPLALKIISPRINWVILRLAFVGRCSTHYIGIDGYDKVGECHHDRGLEDLVKLDELSISCEAVNAVPSFL